MLKSDTSFDQSQTVRTFKLDAQLLPEGIYSGIKCVNSKKIEVSTFLCLHDLEKDTWVSRDIVEKGIWEKKTIGKDSICLAFFIINFILFTLKKNLLNT